MYSNSILLIDFSSFLVPILEISKVVHVVQLLYHLNMKYRVNSTMNTCKKSTSNKMTFLEDYYALSVTKKVFSITVTVYLHLKNVLL